MKVFNDMNLKERGSVPALFNILFDIYHFSSSVDVVSFLYVSRLNNVTVIWWQNQSFHC